MKQSLSESLSQFLASDGSIDNPYQDSSERINTKDFIKKQKELKKEKSSKKKDSFESLVEYAEETLSEDRFDDGEEFDVYIRDFMLEDEDDKFRKELIQRGRQYTRNTSISKEASELQKLYAGSEQKIEKLIKEVSEDNDLLQKDIMHLRAARSKNYRALAEMVEVRKSMHDTTLSAIKELNAMTKAKVELQLKVDKEKKDESGDQDMVANKVIQNVFGMGRDTLIGSYADVSGSSEAGKENSYDAQLDEDKLIHEKYFKDQEDLPETDGDKFLKYEGMGVHYILEVDEDGQPIQIVAEDRDGNVIPDYPTPELTEDLQFNISENTGTATDNLSQKYELRKI